MGKKLIVIMKRNGVGNETEINRGRVHRDLL